VSELSLNASEYSRKTKPADSAFTGVFMTAQAVAKEMIRWGNGGSIAMIASMSGSVANRVSCPPSQSSNFVHWHHPQGLICPAYNASKAAVLQLGRNLASEWGSYGIRVNTISPGYIATAMVEALFEKYPERRRDWPTQNMLGKLSVPEEYRGAAVFCISDASSFMTGSDLKIDGGHTAWWESWFIFILDWAGAWMERSERFGSALRELLALAWDFS
jgi:NAD(P)-dependent dehydrogenase (short-subunit alcohol dehydrogenase family)